jgi:hypothetical protein
MTIYLLDSNVFIQAKNLHYGLDFCPAFWQWLDEAHAAGTVYSIDSVRTELIAGNDDLSAWVQQRPTRRYSHTRRAYTASDRSPADRDPAADRRGYPGFISLFLPARVSAVMTADPSMRVNSLTEGPGGRRTTIRLAQEAL